MKLWQRLIFWLLAFNGELHKAAQPRLIAKPMNTFAGSFTKK
jgi:hypothetical protein